MWDPEFALEKEILTDPYRSIQIHTRFWDPAYGLWNFKTSLDPDTKVINEVDFAEFWRLHSQMALQTLYSENAVFKIQQNPLTSSVIKVGQHFGVSERIAAEIKIFESV